MVLDFTAKWCGPCKLMDPVFQEFAAKYTDVEFIKIDVDELMVCHSFPYTVTIFSPYINVMLFLLSDMISTTWEADLCSHNKCQQGVSQTFQVFALPSFVLVKKGRVADKVVGVRKEELKRMIEEHRN